jgi:hypothetical protein
LTLAIIGPEGTDISGIAETFKAKGAEERSSTVALKSLNQHQLKNRNQLLRHQLMANVFASPWQRKLQVTKEFN